MTESAGTVIEATILYAFHNGGDARAQADAVLDALRSAGYDPEARYEQVGWATRWPKAFPNFFPWSLRDCRANPNDHYGYTDEPEWEPVFRRVDTPQGEGDA